MKYDEDKDLFGPESFGEKLRSHTMDLILLMIVSCAVYTGINAKKNGYVSTDISEKNVKSVQDINNIKTVHFIYSIKQHVY